MSTKRRATAGASPDMATPGSKRRRVTNDGLSSKETPESTTDVGLKLVEQLKEAQDKFGRDVATPFLKLPDKKQFPNYYNDIVLPIAIDTVEGKLNRREYPTLTTVESDLKRMVSNAKSYNEKTSIIYADAERIRKKVSNFMGEHNPAYKDPTYVAFPTPLPNEPDKDTENIDAEGDTEPERSGGRRPSMKIKFRQLSPVANGRVASATPAIEDADGAGESFEGDDFQRAQEKIITELIYVKNSDGEEISGPFVTLPSRQEFADYHRLIKHPVSLRHIQKRVRGVEGRKEATGVSLFKSWQAFEDEVSYIWRNAREYNEDGSAISEAAGEIEAYFKRRVAEAKAGVKEPAQPNGESGSTRLKLRMPTKTSEPPKIHLRLPSKSEKAQPGVTVDSEALRRQQEVVKAGSNGQGATRRNTSPSRRGPRNPFGGSSSGSAGVHPIPTLAQKAQDTQRSVSAVSPTLSASAIKSEIPSGQSPNITAMESRSESQTSNEAVSSPHPATAPTMAPPSTFTANLPTVSPQPPPTAIQPHVFPPTTHTVSPFDKQERKQGQDPLIRNVRITTHPGLKLHSHFKFDIPASRQTHQSFTFTLAPTHYYLRIVPTISPSVSHRQNKLILSMFNSSGTNRLTTVIQRPGEEKLNEPLYETRILPGVNTITVEMLSGAPRGAPKVGGGGGGGGAVGQGQDLEFEKVTLHVNLMRNT